MPRRSGPEQRAHTTPTRQQVRTPKSPERSAAQQGQTPPAGMTRCRNPPPPPRSNQPGQAPANGVTR